MTNEEAKDLLTHYICCCPYGTSPDDCDDDKCPFGMAIRTLCDNARPKGKWIKQENKKTEFFCSECGRMIDTKPFTRTDNFPFCHCGADLRGE